MGQKVLNKLGLYTTKQLGQILRSSLKRQAEDIREYYKSIEQKNTEDLNDIYKSLNRLLELNNFRREDMYLSITPFIDSYKNFHWIVTKIPQINSTCVTANIDVYDYVLSINNEGYLFFEIHANPEGDFKNRIYKPKHIKIIDFIITPQNKGIGSYLINRLEQIAIGLNVSYITGDLVPIDYINRDAQIRFYSRHGYKIKLNKTAEKGTILKNL